MLEKWPIYNLTFPTQYLMCSSLLRFQENYESPKFRDKEFYLEEFMDWYASKNGGKFTYYTDWGGFNFPSSVVGNLNHAGWGGSLSEKENLIINSLPYSDSSFYVVGTEEGADVSALAHEMVHALYYLYPDYGRAVDKLGRSLKKELLPLKVWLKDNGYHSSVYFDECNAYATTGYHGGAYTYQGKPNHAGKRIAAKYKRLFQEHMVFPVKKLSDEKWVKRRIHTVRMGPKLKKIKYRQFSPL